MSRFSHVPAKESPLPKYRKHRASGQAVVTLSGNDCYLGPHGSKASKLEYDRLVGQWLQAGRQLPRAADAEAGLTITELVAAYWRFCKGYYVKDGHPSPFQSTIKLALRHLREVYGRTPAADFGPLALQAMQARFIGAGHSRSYVNKLVAVIRRAFRWGVSQELVPVAVHQALATVPGLRMGRTAAREPEPVSSVPDEVADATLPFLSPVVADMVRFERLTGCRPGEVCALRPMDVDRSGEVWTYRPASHKTQHLGRDRIIFIGPRAQVVLMPYLLRPADSYCFSPVDSESRRHARMRAARKSKVQPSQQTRCKTRPRRTPQDRFVKDSYCRAIARACEKAFGMPAELRKIPRNTPEPEKKRLRKQAAQWRAEHCWSPNQLRHTAATKIRHEHGLEAAQTVLGHSRADVTQIYAERDLALAQRVMLKIG